MKSAKTEIKEEKEPAGQAAGSSHGAVAIADYRLLTVYQRKLRETMNHHTAANSPGGERANGLPIQLKSGIENLSGYSMDDVKVHYNSNRPAQLNALAYAQGTDIHLGPGQEKHLPHEAWHVVQQKQGRVKPSFQFKRGIHINDDLSLEREADVMGDKANQFSGHSAANGAKSSKIADKQVIQRVRKSANAKVGLEIETTLPVFNAYKNAKITKMLGIEHYQQIISDYDEENASEEKSEAYEKADAELRFQYDPGYQQLIHEVAGMWKAEVDHPPVNRRLYKAGKLYSDSAIEIVTVPVNSIEEAEKILVSVNTWLNDIVENCKKGPYTVGKYTFDIPPTVKDYILFKDELWGNIQVNVGANLGDLISMHSANLDTISNENDTQKKHAEAMQQFWNDTFWFAVLNHLMKKVLVDEWDAYYLRNISFYYLYSAAAYYYGVNDPNKQQIKNYFPILSKTDINQQITLSPWAKKQYWADNDLQIRWWLGDAIMANLPSEVVKNKDYLEYVDYAVNQLKKNEEPFPDVKEKINSLNDPNLLQLDDGSYAGVYEIRDTQDSTFRQKYWIDTWKKFLL
ncbi:MAG: DUF4157 domain-containing protein [Bacteroidota bacterium]